MNAESTAKKQGKLITTPFPEKLKGKEMEGHQVIVGRKVGIVRSFIAGPDINVSGYSINIYGEQGSPRLVPFDRLFRLVVEAPAVVAGEGKTTTIVRTRKIPVKWTQWKPSIDAGEVDKNVMIDFEEKSIQTTSGVVTMAKIIPIKKQLFNAEDIDDIVDEVWELASQFGADLTVKEALDGFGNIKNRYK